MNALEKVCNNMQTRQREFSDPTKKHESLITKIERIKSSEN